MSMWHGARAPRLAGAALAIAALTVSLTACGGGGGDDHKAGSTHQAVSSGASQPAAGGGPSSPSPSPTTILATLQGSNGLELVVQSAVRDQGGFLTVSGYIKNTSNQVQIAPIQWTGDEPQVKARGRSLAGMTLQDPKGKKRYYVLRDTDGYALTSTGEFSFQSNQSVPFFAQFPAPPASTTQVGIELPTMNTATIAIS